MPATTIKIDPDLYEKAGILKSEKQSISAFVRELIEKEFHARQMRQAAQEYRDFLERNPAEMAVMETWETAPLADQIEPKQP